MSQSPNPTRVKMIAITGGACSGKTTMLERLRENGDHVFGHRMLYVPEASTMLTQGGMSFEDDPYIYQQAILNVQVSLENAYRAYAESLGVDACVICDRGALDGAAYLGEERFAELLDDEYITRDDLKERYDGVIYLVSAAIGAADHYGTTNNEARRESLEEAIALEEATIRCWSDHPNITVVSNDNGKSFDAKMSEAMQALHAKLLAD